MTTDLQKIAEAKWLRRDGCLHREIALALGECVATASVCTLGTLPCGKQPTDPRKKRVLPILVRMYKEGIPITKIAETTGVPATTLYGWRLELGLARNPRSAYVTDEMRIRSRAQFSRDPDGHLRAEAARLYLHEEKSTPEIAKTLGVTSVTISSWLKLAGVETRSSPTVSTRHKIRAANLGSKRWNWKGGITKDRVRLRVSLDMKLAREACFKRDDYRCRDCGQRGGTLNAHHIWPFQSYPDLKFKVSNLLTLCKRCHNAFDRAAGGPVHATIGPFLPAKKKFEVREPPAIYQYRLAA